MSAATVLVPLRGPSGKSRLAPVLTAAERDELVVALARHVLAVAARAPGVGRVVVVTADPWFAAAAVPAGVEVRAQSGRGLNRAVAQARAWLGPAERVVVLHADLPLLVPDDVVALLTADAPVTLASDRTGRGTNAVVLAGAGSPFVTRFGPQSLRAHRVEAARHGLGVAVVDRPGLRHDLDTPADWDALPPAVRLCLPGRPGGPPGAA